MFEGLRSFTYCKSPKGMVQDQGWEGLWEPQALALPCPVWSRSPWAGWNDEELSSGQAKHAENTLRNSSSCPLIPLF